MAKIVLAMIVFCIFGLCEGVAIPDVFKLISAQNPQGDLTGENWRDRIILLWLPKDGAETYIVYRALSIKDPWVELVRKGEKDVVSFGGIEDATELAQTNSLCYKVEAVNDAGQLVRVYEAVCVPKFVYL
jgi:hypothetical protein